MKNIIVHITTWRTRGGIASVLKNIELNRQIDLYQYVYLYAEDGKDTAFDSYMRSRGNRVVVLPKLSFPIGICQYIRSAYDFYRDNAEDIAIIQIHTPNIAFIHLLLAKVFGIKVRIVHSHSTRYSDNRLKAFCNSILCFPLHFFHISQCACGKDAAIFLFGQKKWKDSYIFHNAIEVKNFRFDMDRRLKRRHIWNFGNSIVYGHVGNLQGPKNHIFLIEIFRKIKDIQPNSVLLLVGTGPLEFAIKSKVQSLNLTDSVHFLGQRDDVADILMALDVFLFPSLFEGFPVSLVEAQCAGLPCLVSDTITREVAITDLVHFLPIHEGAEALWVKELERIKLDSRRDYSQVLQTAGYDLPKEVKALETHYQKLCHNAYGK